VKLFSCIFQWSAFLVQLFVFYKIYCLSLLHAWAVTCKKILSLLGNSFSTKTLLNNFRLLKAASDKLFLLITGYTYIHPPLEMHSEYIFMHQVRLFALWKFNIQRIWIQFFKIWFRVFSTLPPVASLNVDFTTLAPSSKQRYDIHFLAVVVV